MCCGCGGGCREGEDCPTDPLEDQREQWELDFDHVNYNGGSRLCPAEARAALTYLCEQYVDNYDCSQIDNSVVYDYDSSDPMDYYLDPSDF
jgi:hypothetical protein